MSLKKKGPRHRKGPNRKKRDVQVSERRSPPKKHTAKPKKSTPPPKGWRYFPVPPAPSFLILFGSILLFAFLLACRQLYSPDVGFHLKAASWILENLRFPEYDTFNSNNHALYIDLHWLYQIILYATYRLGGAPAIVFSNALLFALSCAIVAYRYFRRGGAFTLRFLFLLLLAVMTMLPILATRPHTFSWIYLNLLLLMLEGYEDTRNTRWLYGLPLIMILWVNCHGLFVLGLAAIAAYWLGDLRRERAIFTPYMRWASFSVLSCLLNPYFLKGFLSPITLYGVMSKTDLFRSSIRELLPPFTTATYVIDGEFDLINILFYIHLFFLLSVLALLINRKNTSLSEYALFALFAFVLSTASKNIGFFVFAVLPVTALAFQHLRIPPLSNSIQAKLQTFGYSILAVLLFYNTVNLLSDRLYQNHKMPVRFGFKTDSHVLPVEGARFLNDHHLYGKIVNPLTFGGYLMFHLPQQVFIDGRLELMDTEFYREYGLSYEPGRFGKLLKKYDIQIAILAPKHHDDWMVDLYKEKNWRPVYFDDACMIFLRQDYAPHIPAIRFQDTVTPADFLATMNREDQILRKRPALNPFAPAIHTAPEMSLSAFHYEAGDIANAIYWALSALDKTNDNGSEIYHNLMAFYTIKGDYHRSKYCFSRTLDHTRHPFLRLVKTGIRDIFGKPFEPEKQPDFSFRYVDSMKGLSGQVLEKMGIDLFHEKDYQGALASFNKAIRLLPTDSDAYYNRGTVYHEINQIDKALLDFTQALKLNPHHTKALNNLSAIYSKTRRFEPALRLLHKLISIDPTYAKAYYNIGSIYFEQNRREEGISYLDQAVNLDPSLGEACRKILASFPRSQ